MPAYRTQVNIHMDSETVRKMEAVVAHLGTNKTAFIRDAVLKAYEQITDTIRVPVIGKVEGDRVFLGTDNKYE